MNPGAKAAARWGSERVARIHEQFRQTAEPYQAKLDSVDGQMALIIVSGIVRMINKRIEAPPALDDAIAVAVQLSGVPAEVFDSFARLQAAMLAHACK